MPPKPQHNDFSTISWDSWVPDQVATLVFVLHEGKILLIRKKRGLGAGKITGPGGRLEPGETPEACARRELHEEVGLRVNDLFPAGDLAFQFTDGLALFVHVYTADNYRGTCVETDEAIPLWFALDAIPYREMWADDYLWIPLLEGKQRFSGRFLFDGDALLEHQLRLR